MSTSGPESEALLAAYDGPEPDRVRRAVRLLAHGDMEEFRILVDAARLDYRDVLAWEEQERLGLSPPRVDVDRLVSRLSSTPVPARAAGAASVVLVNAGPGGSDVLKAVRSVTGLGLAAALALVQDAPVSIVDGLTLDEATAIKARLETCGATVEVR